MPNKLSRPAAAAAAEGGERVEGAGDGSAAGGAAQHALRVAQNWWYMKSYNSNRQAQSCSCCCSCSCSSVCSLLNDNHLNQTHLSSLFLSPFFSFLPSLPALQNSLYLWHFNKLLREFATLYLWSRRVSLCACQMRATLFVHSKILVTLFVIRAVQATFVLINLTLYCIFQNVNPA